MLMLSRHRSEAVQRLFDDVAASLLPPRKLSYSEWAIENFRLSGVASAATGRFRPWKFQRGILDAIGDPTIPRISVIKSTRTGYTKSLIASIGAIVGNDPGPIILLMPTDDDARGIMVDEVDPAFKESPALRGLMRQGRFDGRNTLTQRSFVGNGSLKAIAAAAPRNLRRHSARFLFCDEVDGMKITKEGDPLKIAEKRTDSYPDRKIVMGSTPVDDAASIIIKRYNESDQRIFEIECPHCLERWELLWEHIDFTPGNYDDVTAICQNCGAACEEKFKPQMVENGEWRITRPEIKGHAGFRLNALISMFSNVSWGKLVEEFEKAKRAGPADEQVFVNTVLGKVWSSAIDYVSENVLMARAEDFGIMWDVDKSCWREDIPADVAYITAGVDTQIDRLEVTFLGHSDRNRWILGHHVVRGSPKLRSTWDELYSVLTTQWKHALGGHISVSASCIDSGEGTMTQYVYDFCERTQGEKIVAIKGDDGPRPIIQASKGRRRKRTATLYIVGVDGIKTDILTALALEKTEPSAFRFSNTLTEEYFFQLNAERRVQSYKDGRPIVTFERVGRRKAEALDSVVYGIAARHLLKLDYPARYAELTGEPTKKRSLAEAVAKLHKR
jgi:phage terminase large subunit GpA-like protein